MRSCVVGEFMWGNWRYWQGCYKFECSYLSQKRIEIIQWANSGHTVRDEGRA